MAPVTTLYYLLYGALAAISGVAAFPSPPNLRILEHAPPGIRYEIPKSTRRWMSVKNTAPKISQHTQQLRAIQGPITTSPGSLPNGRSAAAVLGANQRHAGGSGYQNITTASAYGTQYAIEALWDGQPLSMLLDTGCADTWAVQRSFSCVGEDLEFVKPQTACAFGGGYYPETFGYGPHDPKMLMLIKYGDGEVVSGAMGFSDITIGNVTAKRQLVGLASTTHWFGNNQTSGVVGLAFPALTHGYSNETGGRVQYSPVFTTMVSQGGIEPVFSIAIDRNTSTGVLALGGIPLVEGMDYGEVASLDMIITRVNSIPETASEYSFYTVIPDGWYYDQTMNTKKYPYIVDSGTTLCYLPPTLAESINSAFHPPALYNPQYNAYFTSCDAIPPRVAVVLDGIRFWINPVDLVYRNLADPETGLCMTAIADGGVEGPYILGDVFMQNALVVFDVGAGVMKFVSREY